MNSATYTDRGIPRSLAPFFQEYDLEALDPERASATIIERTLRYGNRAELRWLFQCYSKQVIADWVRRWGRYGLPAPHLAFWRLFLGLEGRNDRVALGNSHAVDARRDASRRTK